MLFEHDEPNRDLAKNFKLSEFACKCGSPHDWELSIELVERLQTLRSDIGRSITITSGYRCAEHNVKVGGVSNSRHTKGIAVDIMCRGIGIEEFAFRAVKAGFHFVQMYDNRLHVDIGDVYKLSVHKSYIDAWGRL